MGKNKTKQKKTRCTEIQDIEFNWKQPCHFFVRLYFLSLKFSVHSPVSHIKRCCLIPCSQYQSLFLAAFEVKYAWYLRSFPIHLLISSYLFRTHDNSNFFSVSIKGSSYRESTVVSNDQNPLLASTPRGIKQKKFIFNPWINLHVISAYHEQ